MRVPCRALAGVGLLLLVASGPLSGQNYRETLGLYGGGSWFGDLTPELPVETRLATDWLAGFHTERWAGRGRVGLRLSAAYAQRALLVGDSTDFNLYTGDISLLVRLLRPKPSRVFAPYLAFGGGAIHFNSTRGPSLADNYYEDPVTRPMAKVALGTDLFASSPVGFQLEVADHVLLESPFGDPAAATSFQPMHQAVVRLALQIRADRITPAPAPVLVASRPRPEQDEPPPSETVSPEPGPEPEPSPAPAPAPSSTALDSVAAAVQANSAELTRLRTRMLDVERALEQRPAADPSRVAARPASGRLYTVQVGAYRNAQAARQMADRMRRTGIPVWVSQVTLNGLTFHRVRLGALPNHPEARQLAQRVRQEFSVPIWVAPIGQSDNLPADAVPATRAAISGS